jgi:hypothetical protein
MVIILASCKSTKRLGPMPDRSQFEITKALKDRNIDFDWFSGKMSTALESPDESVSGSMQIRMKKDSVMFVVVKKFGIEISRIQADKEGYTILYRWETAYETGPISQINEIISLSASFEDLQQLIFGNVLLPDDNSTEITKDSIYYVVSTKIDDLAIQYYVNGYSMELEKMSISDKMNRTAFAQYKDYRQVGQYGKIPFERTFTFPYSPSANATINMKFSELEINVPKEIKFSIPAHYEKIN